MKRIKAAAIAALSAALMLMVITPGISSATPPGPSEKLPIQLDVVDRSAPSADQYFKYDDAD